MELVLEADVVLDGQHDGHARLLHPEVFELDACGRQPGVAAVFRLGGHLPGRGTGHTVDGQVAHDLESHGAGGGKRPWEPREVPDGEVGGGEAGGFQRPPLDVAVPPLWRLRQFEYTWLRTAGERYRDFWHITEDALKYACASMKLQLSAAHRDNLMNAYHELRPWPDVLEALIELKHRKIRVVFLTNFTADMIVKNLQATEFSSFFEDHLTTDRVGAFKPSPRAYKMALDYFGYQRHEIAFVAFAPWDVAGAKWFGYPTVWINRAGVSPEELDVLPDFMADSLSDTEMFF